LFIGAGQIVSMSMNVCFESSAEACSLRRVLLRKEVIQPHLPVRLPCYDFTPLTGHTLNSSSPLRG
jgi:hypothetical protein